MTDHLNDIQQMCTDLSGDPELVVGSIYGLRQWSLQPSMWHAFFQGRSVRSDTRGLFGHRSHAWDPSGVNEATCDVKRIQIPLHANILFRVRDTAEHIEGVILEAVEKHPTAEEIYSAAVGRSSQQLCKESLRNPRKVRSFAQRVANDAHLDQKFSLSLELSIPVKEHEITAPECICGFYAYTDQKSLEDNSNSFDPTVFGIVKAWGLVTQGTKGFRSQYAQVVGLTVPMRREYSFEYETITAPWRIGSGNYRVNVASTMTSTWGPDPSEYDINPPDYFVPAEMPRYDGLDTLMVRYRELTT